ncbi:hypothetical protein NYP18_11890 [Corynebacterium sp. YIM 101645]|uniref:Glycosyl transferase family 28 C-terminal domain-containing protein n=1 Tax=Corynebacterium lemuris TaxID=1859292 RepID=A0ABT2FZA8_9CORY|nr:hypothetical protein [Corynebacterium lemuris]
MIGFYAHHQGRGHLQRCRAIMAELGAEAQLLSTDATADVVLADDAAPGAPALDTTARGTLHYVPYRRAGLTRRMAEIAAWIDEHRPAAFYVDVSVEVALLARLLGVPVVTLAMPGVRDDAAHQLAYRQADAIIAAWPDWVPVPAHLHPHADRLHPVGGISRFGQPAGPVPDCDVVVLSGRGGTGWTDGQWAQVRAACPGRDFVFLGRDRFVDDPMPWLAAANVVVSAAGQNSVADIASAQARAVILPQERPFAEQRATASLLDAAGLAVVAHDFPGPAAWPGLLEQAQSLDSTWHRWQTSGAASRAAEAIRKVAEL